MQSLRKCAWEAVCHISWIVSSCWKRFHKQWHSR